MLKKPAGASLANYRAMAAPFAKIEFAAEMPRESPERKPVFENHHQRPMPRIW